MYNRPLPRATAQAETHRVARLGFERGALQIDRCPPMTAGCAGCLCDAAALDISPTTHMAGERDRERGAVFYVERYAMLSGMLC